MTLKRILFIPDTHRPYHDERAWKLMLKVGKLLKPDTIVIQGDFGDCYTISDHDKDPNRGRDLEPEVKDVNKGLDELDALGASRKIFVEGNHEYRLGRFLMTKAPELYNMLSIPELYNLRSRGWKYVPYKSSIEVGKINVTHDVGTSGRNAIFRSLDTFQHNVSTGHTHRLAYIVEGNAKGEAHVSASFGWLGDKSKADYMHQVKANRDWALGFGIGYQRHNGTMHLLPMPIINYSVVFNGELVT